jgi:hypothetical protein
MVPVMKKGTRQVQEVVAETVEREVQVCEMVPVTKKATRTVCSYQPVTEQRQETYQEMVPVTRTVRVAVANPCPPNPCPPAGVNGGFAPAYGPAYGYGASPGWGFGGFRGRGY